MKAARTVYFVRTSNSPSMGERWHDDRESAVLAGRLLADQNTALSVRVVAALKSATGVVEVKTVWSCRTPRRAESGS